MTWSAYFCRCAYFVGSFGTEVRGTFPAGAGGCNVPRREVEIPSLFSAEI